MKTSPSITSFSSRNIVLNTSVTQSDFAFTYLWVKENSFQWRYSAGHHKFLRCLVVPVVDHCSLLPLALRLEVDVFFEHRRGAIPFQQTNLPYDVLPVVRDSLEVDPHEHLVAVIRGGKQVGHSFLCRAGFLGVGQILRKWIGMGGSPAAEFGNLLFSWLAGA